MKQPALERAFVVVLDGVGTGALPDAGAYGDAGADTLGNLSRRSGGLHLPALEALGLGAQAAVEDLEGGHLHGAAGKMAEKSPGKDSTTGHWELAGVVLDRPFPTFPKGFPREVVEAFEKSIGRKTLGNRPASGTEIIAELGREHLRTKRPILYTSADSVFQVAAHGDVVPVDLLYRHCLQARDILDEMHLPVLRVIARPFSGPPGAFRRSGRRDFSIPPPEETVLEALQGRGWPTLGIGKVGDLFCGRGFDRVRETASNDEGMAELRRALSEQPRGIVIANLIDFDTLYGHRNDVAGFVGALEAFDRFLGARLLPSLGDGDLLIVTADHGCDPTSEGTDHTREYVPLHVFSTAMDGPASLGIRESFADVAATLFEAFTGLSWHRGRSFWKELPFGSEAESLPGRSRRTGRREEEGV